MSISTSDLIITVAYFSIPVQILFSLWKYPRLARMPTQIYVLVVLFAFFIFLCGAGHLLRTVHRTDTLAFAWTNGLTALVSLITALYLLPFTPILLGSLDQSLQDLMTLNREISDSKDKLFTFMAFLCHEIRNPLFAITSSASFLGDTDLTEEQETGVGSIFDSSLLMLRLVNDVLDLSKIDAGKLELEEREFDLHRLLENLEKNMRVQITQKHKDKVELRFDVAPNLPKIVLGDSVRMLQIIYNLLSNSSKFTKEGHIALSVSVLEEETIIAPDDLTSSLPDHHHHHHHQQGMVNKFNQMRRSSWDVMFGDHSHFSLELLENAGEDNNNNDGRYEKVKLSIMVTDTGVGIDPERIKTIFEPYSQAKLSDYRKHGGTGLGLSILSSLTKLMGGDIDVTSKPGKGTNFSLKLPIKVSMDQLTTISENTIDMTDPFLSARRLPVYKKQTSKQELFSSASNDVSQGLHHDDAGIKFFHSSTDILSTATSSKPKPPTQPGANAQFQPTTIVPKQKRPPKKNLPRFHLPPDVYVLVVDDNCVNRKIIGKMLKFYNIAYREAENGLEAVKMARLSRNAKEHSTLPFIGLIFMDLSMPVMDGYTAIETIRREKIDVPIVALTANALSKERERALELGANEFHTKPILRNDLHAICGRFMKKLETKDSIIVEENGIKPQVNMTKTDSARVASFKEAAAAATATTGMSSFNGSSGKVQNENEKTLGDQYKDREGYPTLLRHDIV